MLYNMYANASLRIFNLFRIFIVYYVNYKCILVLCFEYYINRQEVYDTPAYEVCSETNGDNSRRNADAHIFFLF